MPESKNEKFVFDRNRFVNDLNAVFQLPYFIRMFNDLREYHSRGELMPGRWEGIKSNTELESQIKFDKKSEYLANLVYELYNHPDKEELSEFYQFWPFIHPLFEPRTTSNKPEIALILKKIGIFDEKTQLTILKKIQRNENDSSALYREASIQIMNNPYATIDDYYNYVYIAGNDAMARDTLDKLEQQLESEMAKDYPDKHTIDTICNMGKNLAAKYRFDQEKEMFNETKLLENGATYISKIRETLSERAEKAEKRAKEAEIVAENEHRRVNAKEDENIELRNKIAKMEHQLDEIYKQNIELKNQLGVRDNFIKTLKMKFATLKAGLFNGGKIKEVQDWVQQSTSQFEK